MNPTILTWQFGRGYPLLHPVANPLKVLHGPSESGHALALGRPQSPWVGAVDGLPSRLSDAAAFSELPQWMVSQTQLFQLLYMMA
jgi:hypothetical protein